MRVQPVMMLLRMCGICLLFLPAFLPLSAAEKPSGKGGTPGTQADGKRTYQPAGVVADPKVAARWNRYHDYAQATELLRAIAEAYPKRCRLESLGKSHGGREMWVMTVSNVPPEKQSQTPAFWIDGGIHANEIQSVEVVLYTAWYLAEMSDRSETIGRLLDERVFYLLPMMSPDSRDDHFYEPNTTHSPRGGQMPVDDDRDGRVDEDPPDDLNGDGHITQMRIRDPHGRHKPHPDYPHLMVRVEADEKGEFTLLGSEGFDNDEDGRLNEDGDGYYDPNRDFPWNWQPASVQRGAYRYPLSVPENRLAAEFILAHPNIAGAQSYHNTGGMLLRGPGAKNDRVESDDVAVYDKLGKTGEEMLPGYKYLVTATGLYEAHGTMFDWFYGMRGVVAFTNELNTPFNLFRKASGGGFFPRKLDLHKFDRYLLFGQGLVEWQQVEHPEYGKVEVGGMKKTWSRQPPSFLLEEECHRNMAFTIYHADQMPQAEVDDVAVEARDGGLFEVRATVVNRKLIPTRTARDVQKKTTPPDRVELAGEGIRVLAALTSDSVVFRSPQEHPRQPESIRVETLRSRKPLYVRWLVEGEGVCTVTVRSVKGGVATRMVELSQ